MIVAHVGPPLGRTGGPAGYIHQLQSAAAGDTSPRHDVRFPNARREQPAAGRAGGFRSTLTRVKQALFGAPDFYRPSHADLAQPGGTIDRMMRELTMQVRAETANSLERAADAHVVVTHEPFSTEMALQKRRNGQRIWMMVHAVMPLSLYTAWSWGRPAADWRPLMELPDVAA